MPTVPKGEKQLSQGSKSGIGQWMVSGCQGFRRFSILMIAT